ncbi:MAG: translocation/assembly module TamB domain-containing protein [Alcanivoracaceae bacterium]
MKYILVVVIVAAILLQVAAAGLLGTQAGSRWLVRQLAPLVPGEVQIGEINGTVLKGLTLSNVHYRNPTLSASLTHGQIRVDWSRLWHGWISVDMLELRQLQITLPEQQEQDAMATVLPASLALPFGVSLADAQISALSVTRNGETLFELDHLQLRQARARRQLSLGRLDAASGSHQLAIAALNMSLTHPYALNARLDWSSHLDVIEAWLGDAALSGNATLSGSLQSLQIQHTLTKPQALDSALSVRAFEQPQTVTSQHRWQQLALTLPDNSLLLFDRGALAFNLDNGRFNTELDTSVRRQGLPDAALQLSAAGSADGSDHLQATLRHKESELILSGNLSWRPALAFAINVDGRRLDPALFLPALPGDLQVQASVRGSQHNDGWHLAANDAVIRGQLRDHPVLAVGNGEMTPSLISVNARAEYDNNVVTLDGHANQQLDLRSDVQLANPAALHASLKGSLNASLRIHGSRNQPLIDVDARSASIGFEALRLDDIKLQGRALGTHSDNLSLTWQSGKLTQLGQLILSQTHATLLGDSRRHTLAWSVAQPDAGLSAQLSGRLDPNTLHWQGTLDDLQLTLADFDDWRLLGSTVLSASADSVALPQTCLTDGNGRACTRVELSENSLDAELTISGLPLGPFSALVGPAVQLEGTLEHASNIRRDANQHWQGSLKSDIHNGAILLEDGVVDYRVELVQATIETRITHPRAYNTASVTLRDHGSATAELVVDLFDINAPLSGHAGMDLSELRWLELLAPGVRQISGRLNGRLTVAGSRQRPLLHGSIELSDAEADVPDAGLTLRDIRASVRAADSRLELTANVQSGPGTIRASGVHDFSAGLPGRLDLTITGERFRALNLPDITLLVNPDIRVTTLPGQLRVRGEVMIPEARMTPVELPQMAVRVSDDEILINAPEATDQAIAVDAEIMLRLGRDVQFRGFGLDARLGGNLQLIEKPDLPLNLQGDLRIEEGRYRAYGQNLAIDRGVLLFQDQIDNPGLDIRAVRRIPSAQVVAGVAISGTLKEPEARLYSEPAMEESEIMSWLLTGRGLSGTAQNDNAMIAQALAVYGLERGSGVTDSIGDRLGLDEISLGSDWETSDAALMLGKQINDRLYLRYAIGLFDAVSTVMLRYTLSRKVHLEAQSGGDRQSLDLIYQIEH